MPEVVEHLNHDESHTHRVEDILHEETTTVQNVKIARLSRYGLSLILDDRVQSTELDEAVYHEGIVIPLFLVKGQLGKVLCIGGANGGIIRELFKLPSRPQIHLLDIDKRAFEISRRYLPHMFTGVNWNEGISIQFGNIHQLVTALEHKFDAIFNDVADAIEGMPAVGFYTDTHFRNLKTHLAANGVVVTQAGAVEHISGKFFSSVHATLASIFGYTKLYLLDIPSYGLPWGFILASDTPIDIQTHDVERALRDFAVPPSTYDLETHLRNFSIPLVVRNRLLSTGRLITQADPLLTFGVP